LVSRPKLGFFHAAFLAASFIGVQGGTIKEPIKTWEKNGWFFFFVSYHLLITWINDLWGVLFILVVVSLFVLFRVFNVLCLTCNHRFVEEGLFVFFGEWEGA
jgi:hypothetical protein